MIIGMDQFCSKLLVGKNNEQNSDILGNFWKMWILNEMYRIFGMKEIKRHPNRKITLTQIEIF